VPEAWILGDLDLVRPLRMAGIPCAIAAPPQGAAAATRLARHLGWADPWRDPEGLLELLLRGGRAAAERPVLFYQLDAYATFISEHREQLSEVFRFVMCEPETLGACLDKTRFANLAQELGLPVPASRVVTPAGSAVPDPGLGWPLVVKPSVHNNRGWGQLGGKRKVLRVDDEAAWHELWPRLVSRGEEVLLQELVPGAESQIESYHAYLAPDGQVVAEFTGRKIRTYPLEHGHTTALVVTHIADVQEVGRDVVRRMRLAGVVKLDFKRDPNGALVLLEANPRFNLWHYPAAYTGVNLPALVWSDLTGLPVADTIERRAEARWWAPRDLQAAMASGVTLRSWLRFARGCEARSLVALDDPMPVLKLAWRRLGRTLRAS
jgi:D-aspartate ligase